MNNQKEGIDCTSNANQKDSIDDTHNVNQNNSSTENIDFEINEFKKLLQNCTYNVFGIDLKKYITKEPENCFSIFVRNPKTTSKSFLLSTKKPGSTTSAGLHPIINTSDELLTQPESFSLDYIKRSNTDSRNKIKDLKQLFLSHRYEKVPITFNQSLLSKQLKVYMMNKNFFLAKFEGFSLYDTEGHFFPTILTERPVNGPLITLFEKVRNVTEEKKIAIICGITSAIFNIHENGFIHSNLNVTTVYLNDEYFPIICDYIFIPGFKAEMKCQEEEEEEDDEEEKVIDFIYKYESKEMIDSFQNRLYTAPEVLNEKEFDNKSDIYSLGLIIYFILCEQEATLDSKGLINITKTETLNDKWNNMSEEWKDIIINCTLEDSTKRPTAKDILTRIFQANDHFSKEIDPYMKFANEIFQSKETRTFLLNRQVIPNFNDISYYTQLTVLAAEKCNSDSIAKVGYFFLKGENGLIKDEQSAFFCYKKASDLNNVEASLKLAEFYNKGIGTPIDINKSCYAYDKAYKNMDINDSRRPEIDLKRRTLTLKVNSKLTKENIQKQINQYNKSKNKIEFKIDQEFLIENEKYKQMTLIFDSYIDLAKSIKSFNQKKNDYIINTLKSESKENSCLDSLTEVLDQIELKSYMPIIKEEGTYDKNKRDEKYVMLGTGSYAKVFLVHKIDEEGREGELFAAKVFKVPVSQSGDLTHQCPLNLFKREVFTVSRFDHPSIIKYIGYNPYSLIEKLENSKEANTLRPTLIMEYKENGNLETSISTGKFKKDQTTKLKNIIGIASGIKYLHKNNVVHRDLKPVNIILDKKNEPVICDFGCSRQYSAMIDNRMTSTIGSYIYMAPELFEHSFNQIYTYHVDTYSFGIILFQILTDTPQEKVYTTNSENEEAAMHQINKMKLENQIADLNSFKIHPFFVDLIKACWNTPFLERPDPDTVYYELIKAVEILGEDLLPGANINIVNEYIERLRKYE